MKKITLPKLAVYATVTIVTFFTMFPFYIMIVMGTHTTETVQQKLVLLPGSATLANLAVIFASQFALFYWNSFFVAVLSTAGTVAVSALAGYGFAKYEFKGKKTLFFLLIATLMIPGQLGLVGFMVQMRYMHLFNNLWALILPSFANAFSVYWMATYIRPGVPGEIIESGRIDGCGELKIFIRLAFPLMRPAIITIMLLSFLGSWNNYFGPLVMITSEKKFTIPLGVRLLGNLFKLNYAAQILALTLAILPIVVMFAFFSQHLIAGLVSGSVKE